MACRSNDNTRKTPIYREPTAERLMRSAVAYLARYATSSQNLRRVMMRKVTRAAQALGKDPAAYASLVEATVARCVDLRLVDDVAYAETRTVFLRQRGLSRRGIAAKLSAKGVERAVIEAALAQDPSSEMDAARRLAQRRRIGPWRTRGDRDQLRERDMAVLCRAGFAVGVARSVIDGADASEDDGEGPPYSAS